MKGLSIIWVVAELLAFFLVAKVLGFIMAVGLVVLSMLLGGVIMRWQGLENLNQLQTRTAKGEPPATTAIHAVAIVLGGLLMVIPGFITSIIGILLLIPRIRDKIAAWIVNHRVISPKVYRTATRGDGRVIDADDWKSE